MDIIELVKDIIQTLGFPIAMVVYFAWRDVKFMDKLDGTLDTILQFIKKEG